MSMIKGRYVKANALVNAAYRLTVAEQRVLIMALMQANARNITDQMLYEVKASDMMVYTGADLKATIKILKDAAQRLKRRQLHFYETQEGRPLLLSEASWVQTIKYEPATHSVYLRFNHDMLPYINRLTKRFTVVHMVGGPDHYMLSLGSNFSYRLLEMMCQWIDRGWFKIDPETLKRQFALVNQYQSNAELKRRVIDKAVNELNEKTGWQVEYETHTGGLGGRIIAFTFRYKPPKEVIEARQKAKENISESDIKKHAQPGETHEQVRERLSRTRQQINKIRTEVGA